MSKLNVTNVFTPCIVRYIYSNYLFFYLFLVFIIICWHIIFNILLSKIILPKKIVSVTGFVEFSNFFMSSNSEQHMHSTLFNIFTQFCNVYLAFSLNSKHSKIMTMYGLKFQFINTINVCLKVIWVKRNFKIKSYHATTYEYLCTKKTGILILHDKYSLIDISEYYNLYYILYLDSKGINYSILITKINVLKKSL